MTTSDRIAELRICVGCHAKLESWDTVECVVSADELADAGGAPLLVPVRYAHIGHVPDAYRRQGGPGMLEELEEARQRPW